MRSAFKKYFLFLLVVALLVASLPVAAQGLVPANCRRGAPPPPAPQCGLADLMTVVVNVVNFLFAFAGFVALGYLLWGGIQMLISGGNPERIKNGKTTITNALVGLVLVYGAYLVLNIAINAFTGGAIGGVRDIILFWR
jgi:hypothetical protein